MADQNKRWHPSAGLIETPKVDAFVAEVAEVCRKHGLDFEPGDIHGGSIIYTLREGAEPCESLGCAALGDHFPLDKA